MYYVHLLVGSLPEDCEQVDGADGRLEEAGDLLDVDEQLAALRRLDDGNPQDADHHQHQDAQPE